MLAGRHHRPISYLLLTATLAYRLAQTWHAGLHGSRRFPPIDLAWVDVDGAGPAEWDAERYQAAAQLLRDRVTGQLAGTTEVPRTRYQPRAAGFDVAPAQVTRSRAAARIASSLGTVAGLAWVTAAGAGVLDDAMPSLSVVRNGAAVVLGVSLALLIPLLVATWVRKRIARRRAAELNGVRVAWWMLARAHGWRLTRPGVYPVQHWAGHRVFANLVDRTARPPMLSLSGRVGPWDVWVLAGQGGGSGNGLVAALILPGAVFPHLGVARTPRGTHDEFQWHAASPDFQADVLTPDLWEHLVETLPVFAELVITDDLVALALTPETEPEPWRAEYLVACLVGVADLIPAEVLDRCLVRQPVDPDVWAPLP